MKTLAIALMLAAAAGSAAAQAIYRCGSAYSQTPCPDGRIVDSSDPRSAAQRAEAHSVAMNARKQAHDMEQARLAEAAALKPSGAVSLSAALAPVAQSPRPKGKTAGKKKSKKAAEENKDFVALVPSAPK